MNPTPGTLCAAAVTPSSAVRSGPSGTARAVSDSAEKRSESECEPIPRAPPRSRMATSPVPTVSNFARPKGYRRLGGRRDRRHENKTTKSPKRSTEKGLARQHGVYSGTTFLKGYVSGQWVKRQPSRRCAREDRGFPLLQRHIATAERRAINTYPVDDPCLPLNEWPASASNAAEFINHPAAPFALVRRTFAPSPISVTRLPRSPSK